MESNQLNSPHKRRDQYTKIEQLKQYISRQKYIDIVEQPKVCAAFNLPFLREIFRQVYRQRFFDYLAKNTTTVATVEQVTKIPQKYLTICKLYYEKRGLLKVIGTGTCPTTKSRNVQFVTTNMDLIRGKEQFFINHQTSLF